MIVVSSVVAIVVAVTVAVSVTVAVIMVVAVIAFIFHLSSDKIITIPSTLMGASENRAFITGSRYPVHVTCYVFMPLTLQLQRVAYV